MKKIIAWLTAKHFLPLKARWWFVYVAFAAFVYFQVFGILGAIGATVAIILLHAKIDAIGK